MTLTRTPGAYGSPDRIDLDQYRHAIGRAPELVYHLAHLVTPGAYHDGQPRARDMQAAPGRLAPLDELDELYVWLWREAAAWIGHAALDADPISHMVRRDDTGRPIGCRWIVSDDDGAEGVRADAQHLVRLILSAWPTIATWYGSPALWGQAAARQWTDDVDEHLLAPLARWPLTERSPVPARARECPTCGERDVWADLDSSTGVCASCRAVVRPDVWVPIRTAAQILDVAERTVRDWIAGGLATKGSPRRVELGAAREEKQLRAARSALNLRSATDM